MADSEKLPTISEAISEWLGVQMPAMPGMPQTLRNFDKAIAKVVLAAGENLEARIRGSTGKAKARNKINIEGMFRTEEERRKLENRAAAAQAAIDDMQTDAGSVDAQEEIEDDWLNLFARLTEDKSSDELRRLFGKVLAGEIKKPGSFSLRTIQLATISKGEAALISNFLSYAIDARTVPFSENEPESELRLTMEELGIAAHPDRFASLTLTVTVSPGKQQLCLASSRGILVENKSEKEVAFSIAGQLLTAAARELAPIANSPTTSFEFLRGVALDVRLVDLLERAVHLQVIAHAESRHVLRVLAVGEQFLRGLRKRRSARRIQQQCR
jgi:hypothetical protein